MKTFLAILTLTFAAMGQASTHMNLEGLCSGQHKDGTPVSFSYYSDFDGCKKKSDAAVVFTEGGRLSTGTRSFSDGKDTYAFSESKIIFEDSTGNSGGIFRTESGEDVTVSCEIRDYEYATEC